MSEYYDIKNNYHAITQRVIPDENREDKERDIVDELLRILG